MSTALILGCIAAVVVAVAVALHWLLKQRNMHVWMPAYLRGHWRAPAVDGPRHILFCFVDHYEPQWANRNNIELERQRVDRWCRDYPRLAGRHRDADGRHPIHSFFYPEEEYRREHLDKLAALCEAGYGEVEIHLHHDNDTSSNLRTTLTRFVDTLHRDHGLLPRDPASGRLTYGFIHGNWALDNSRPDGRMCGVDDELLVLKDTGCYADFTMPSAPSDTQTSTINTLYYATDDPHKPKSHDRGVDVAVGVPASGDLMIIQGPLGLNWKDRKFGIVPRIEAGDIRRSAPPTRDRVDLWVNSGIHVKGRPEWVFIKIHTHGAQDTDMDTLLGEPMENMHRYLEERYNDGTRYVLHYVSAREMYNIAKAAEAGETGNPNDYRDYRLPRPVYGGGSGSQAGTP